MVDELIELWRTAGDKPVTATQVAGHRWSARSYEVRDFLARNSVSYRWLNADEPEGRGPLAAAGSRRDQHPAGGDARGRLAGQPGRRGAGGQGRPVDHPGHRLLRHRDRRRRPGRAGRGRVRRLRGLRAVMVERRPPAARPARARGSRTTSASRRGQRSSAHRPGPAPGVQVRGRDPRRGRRHRPGGARLVRVVRFADGGEAPPIPWCWPPGSATTLEAPGVEELTGRGIFYGSTATEAPTCAGEDVYVVGGANAAGQAAVYLSRHARQVTMLVRADGLGAVDVALPHPPDPRHRQHPGAAQHQPGRRLGTDYLERLRLLATPATGRSRRSRRATCSCSSARPPAPNGSAGWSNATARGSSSPASTCSLAAGGHGLAAGPRPLLPGGQRARGVRGRRRQANSVKRRLGGRRGRHGHPARPPLPGVPGPSGSTPPRWPSCSCSRS